jgi:hypothetical protein
MYAVATIHFKQSVDVSRLVAKLATPTGLPTAIAATIFAAKPAVMVTALTATAVYAHLGPSAVCLLLKQGDKQLQLHVECVLTAGSILELKHELSRLLLNISDAAEGSTQATDSVEVVIYDHNANRLTSGRYQPFGEIMGKRFRDTIIGDVLLAVVPAVTGLAFDVAPKQAAITFGTTAIAVLLWLCIEARRRQKVLVYEES